MRDWFEQRPAREQRILLAGTVLLALLLFYAIVWFPVARENRQLEQVLGDRAADLAWMRSAGLEVRSLDRASSNKARADSRTLIARVTAELRRDNIVAKQIRPEGEERLRLTLDGIAFTKLLGPLARLQSGFGIRVREAVVEAGSSSGVVNVRLLLQRDGA